MDLAAEGLLFREIRQFARLNFSRAVFSFAPRACNKLAHALPTFGACHQTSLRIFRMMYPSACPALWLDLCEVWNRCVPFQKRKEKRRGLHGGSIQRSRRCLLALRLRRPMATTLLRRSTGEWLIPSQTDGMRPGGKRRHHRQPTNTRCVLIFLVADRDGDPTRRSAALGKRPARLLHGMARPFSAGYGQQ